jgi:hypothetical protein
MEDANTSRSLSIYVLDDSLLKSIGDEVTYVMNILPLGDKVVLLSRDLSLMGVILALLLVRDCLIRAVVSLLMP